MVNFWLAVPMPGERLPDSQRVISKGPIYKLDEVRRQLNAGSVVLATPKCTKDVAQRLQWDKGDVWAAFNSLASKHYVSSEFCLIQNNVWVCADAYAIYNYYDGNEGGWTVDLYLKFGVSPNGRVLLMISCHPSN